MDRTKCGIRFAGSGVRLTYGLGLSLARDLPAPEWTARGDVPRRGIGGARPRPRPPRRRRHRRRRGRPRRRRRHRPRPRRTRRSTQRGDNRRDTHNVHARYANIPTRDLFTLDSPRIAARTRATPRSVATTTVNAHYNGFMLLIRTHWPGFE